MVMMATMDDTDDDKTVSETIRNGVEAGKTMAVTVLAAMGIEKITDPKEDNE